jgi:hypothetical protein
MRQDIRYVALGAEPERRVRLAARTLAVHGVEASVQPWEGPRCDVVVANADDGYGQQVIEIATRRGVPVISLGQADEGAPTAARLPADATISALANLLRSLLTGSRESAATRNARSSTGTEPRAAINTAVDAVGLVQLALLSDLRKRDIEARIGSRVVYFMRSRGRVLTNSLSDMLESRNQLCEPGWQFRDISAMPQLSAGAEVVGSLDAFLLHAATRSGARLPDFPEVRCALEYWPDLGAAPDVIEALRLAGPLLRRPLTPSELIRVSRVEPAHVHACLWAFEASGLLRRDAGVDVGIAAPSTPSARGGIWSRLASHFGLSRARVDEARAS